MRIENVVLAGGAALSLLAGALTGQYALLPTHGGPEAQEMTPLRVEASPPTQEAQRPPLPAEMPPSVEKVDISQSDSLPSSDGNPLSAGDAGGGDGHSSQPVDSNSPDAPPHPAGADDVPYDTPPDSPPSTSSAPSLH